MGSSRIQRKAFLLFLTFGGYLWIFLSDKTQSSGHALPLLCPIKIVSGYPCPSCGSTRALTKITQGRFSEAFLLNPIAYGLAIGALLAPFLLYSEFTTKPNQPTLSDRIESVFKKPIVFIPSILIVLINWYWNYKKGL